ncbi:acyl-CoA synthetase [Actinomadura macrotermitis]|uniref:3-oxocholest-4-en-26-oate--CoA ligase n=1 Tax=Actinomadura macrotermitis TaxID=2585200 RepID=A0A7K0BXK9_9ACTN|nr:acyl-CoA synthetase [Actinomadura macrotermitis]MQY05582.1 3-oxocholest-4-en-26-oate--CoA ligase [Actinomadura macrotermitis]
MPRSFNLADLFETVADAVPDKLALVAGDVRLTYRELDERANRVAHHLAAAGVTAGDHVSILAYNRAEWLEAQIGAFKLRAVPVNVNYRYTAGELAHVIGDSESVALVGERSLIARLGEARDGLTHLRHVLVIEDGSADEVPGGVAYEDALKQASPGRDFEERSGDDLYLIYTGGTTGLPKGVMWRSEDIFMSAMFGGNMLGDPIASPEELTEKVQDGGLTTMVCAPMMHGAGMWVAWIALTSGSTLVLWTGHAFDAAAVLATAQAERAQVLLLVGDVMARPIVKLLAADPAAYDLSSVLAIGTGGAATSPDVKARLHELIPSLLLVLDAFGGSETGASGQAIEPAPDGSPRFLPRSADVAVLDDRLRRVPPGSDEIGQLARTGRIPLGYWNDEAKTARTFVLDEDGNRWSLQGDMARVDGEGAIVLLGRGSLVVNTGGEKVFVEEVEATLKTHPAVEDALVVGVPDERFGSRVAAVVAARDVTAEELAAHCRLTLAGYKVPRDIVIVDEVRRSPAGKADYRWAKGRLA